MISGTLNTRTVIIRRAIPYELQMWQYASDGRVDGIDGYVDMNISFVDYAAEYGKHQNADFE